MNILEIEKLAHSSKFVDLCCGMISGEARVFCENEVLLIPSWGQERRTEEP